MNVVAQATLSSAPGIEAKDCGPTVPTPADRISKIRSGLPARVWSLTLLRDDFSLVEEQFDYQAD